MVDEHVSLSFELRWGLEAIEQLSEQWLACCKRGGSSFLHLPCWYQSYYQHVGFEPCIVVGRDRDQVVQFIALFHIVEVFKKARKLIRLLDLSFANEMGVCDFLSPELNVSVPKLVDFIRGQGVRFQLVRMRGISASSHAYRALSGEAAPLYKLSHASKYLDVGGGADAFYGQYNKKFLRNLRRKISKAQTEGELRLVCASNFDAQPQYQKFLQLEDSGWKGRAGTSIVNQPAHVGLYQALFYSLAQCGALRINLLYLGEKCIAGQFCALFQGRLQILKIAYDEDHAPISPGDLLIDQLIRVSPDSSGFSIISFVTGVTWMDRWKPLAEPVYVFYFGATPFYHHLLTAVVKLRASYNNLRLAIMSK